MRPTLLAIVLLGAATVFRASPAHAHMPSLVDGAFADWQAPFVVTDADWSQVVYHRAGCDAPTLWMRLQAQAGQDLFVQLGVPELLRLQDRQLQLVLLGPGLPDAVPAGLDAPAVEGALVFDATVTEQAPLFHEPFSNTDSRIVIVRTLTLPSDGTYYLAARFVDGRAGKLWLSTGTVEKFDADAIKRVVPLLDEIKRFHEALEDPTTPVDGVDPVCPAQAEAVDPPAQGCVAASTASPRRMWVPVLMALGALVCVRLGGRRRVR